MSLLGFSGRVALAVWCREGVSLAQPGWSLLSNDVALTTKAATLGWGLYIQNTDGLLLGQPRQQLETWARKWWPQEAREHTGCL